MHHGSGRLLNEILEEWTYGVFKVIWSSVEEWFEVLQERSRLASFLLEGGRSVEILDVLLEILSKS